MKVAVVSESPADEAAIKIIVDAIVGHETILVSAPRLRPGGWPQVLTLLPNIITALHYHTDADAVAVVVDSDNSPAHVEAHQVDTQRPIDCRVCMLRASVGNTLGRLSPIANRETLRTAVGLAVPAIEAWYCCGLNPHVNEARWIGKLRGEKINYDKRSLKVTVYGSDQPNLATETGGAVRAANRLAGNIEQLEQLFPNGFGCFVTDIRGWLK